MKELYEITIKELAELIENKKVSIKEVVEEYISRIQKYDKGEQGFHSIMELNPEAIDIAMDLDRREKFGYLYGIPIVIKGNINTCDKMHTNAGSLALENYIAMKDAEVVKALRDHGAIILGKTNLTELSNYMTEGMPPGYNSVYGQTVSPYKRDGDPSGSSTGSAVAITANFAAASLGTDTAGSILSPAIHNSIVGLRPGSHLVSRQGIIPISFTLDMIGPMARSVEDCSIVYSALSKGKADVKKGYLKGLKIGVSKKDMKHLQVQEAKKGEEVLKRLTNEGAEVKIMDIAHAESHSVKLIQKYEFKYSMNKYLKAMEKESPVRSLKEIIEFNNQHKEGALKYGQSKLIEGEKTKGDLNEEEYIEILRDREEKKRIVMDYFKDINVIIDFNNGLLSQYVGLPSIAIPYGLLDDGMPWGFSLIGLEDEKLLQSGYAVEQAVGNRVVPRFEI